MRQITTRELQKSFTKILAEGLPVEITTYGKIVAILEKPQAGDLSPKNSAQIERVEQSIVELKQFQAELKDLQNLYVEMEKDVKKLMEKISQDQNW